MEIIKKKNIEVKSTNGKPILTDVYYLQDKKPKPVVIFCHGYKGFKDWGAWNIMAEKFAEAGFFLIKFNFSHNGTTPEFPEEFKDIEAFGDNNYMLELQDLQSIIDWVSNPSQEFQPYIDASVISLIGHSRGGGIVTIKAEEEDRITKVVTFASVSDYASRFPEDEETLNSWKNKGVSYIQNSRTKQKLPHHYQFYSNFKENEEYLTISRAAKNLKIPHLIVHGSGDTSVPISDSGDLFNWSPFSEMLLVEGADHVFGISHPWQSDKITEDFNHVIHKTIGFLQKSNDQLIAESRGK